MHIRYKSKVAERLVAAGLHEVVMMVVVMVVVMVVLMAMAPRKRVSKISGSTIIIFATKPHVYA